VGVLDLAGADMLLEGKKLGVKAKTGLIFIHPNFVLRQSLRTPYCSRRPHDSLIGASWVRPLKGGYCYDHVQLQVLSGVRLSEGRGQNNQQPTPNDNTQ